MTVKQRVLWVVALAFLISCEGFGQSESLSVPPFALEDMYGKEVRFADVKGDQVTVLNFWAGWCPPCLREIPLFVRLQEQWQPSGVQFVGISIDDPATAAAWVERLNINYPILNGQGQGISLSQALGNNQLSLPYTAIINDEGVVLKTRLGEVTELMLTTELQSFLENE
jgi:peroxiredoxin